VKVFQADVVVFDLDGTLIDSKKDIADSLNWTLGEMGYDPLPIKTIEKFVGNGIAPLIRRTVEAAGSPESEEKMVALFRSRYWEHLLDHTRLFDTVEETIESFIGRFKMGLVSNKPERYTRRIVEELGLGPAFGDAVFGGDTLPVKKPDPAALHRIAAMHGSEPARMVMVGDSAVDIATAKQAGCHSIGVSYGFRDKEELIEAGADALVDRFDEIRKLIG